MGWAAALAQCAAEHTIVQQLMSPAKLARLSAAGFNGMIEASRGLSLTV